MDRILYNKLPVCLRVACHSISVHGNFHKLLSRGIPFHLIGSQPSLPPYTLSIVDSGTPAMQTRARVSPSPMIYDLWVFGVHLFIQEGGVPGVPQPGHRGHHVPDTALTVPKMSEKYSGTHKGNTNLSPFIMQKKKVHFKY